MIDYMAVGRRLAVMRGALGLGQSEAAWIAGVSLRSWRRWEAGERPSTASVLKICYTHSISLDWLLEGDPRNLRRRFIYGAGRVAVLPLGGLRPGRAAV